MLVRSNVRQATLSLGLARTTVLQLVRLGALDGDLDLPRGEAWVEFDPAWRPIDVWRHFDARGYDFVDEADAVRPGKVRALLGVTDEPWSDAFLQALAGVRGGRALGAVEATKVLRGSSIRARDEARQRYGGLPPGRTAYVGNLPPVELDDLMESSPEPLRTLGGTCLDEDRGVLFERPLPAWTARVGAMPPGNPRWVATLAILAHPTHGGLQARVPELLGVVEDLAARCGGRPLSDGAAVEAALRERLAEEVSESAAGASTRAGLSVVFRYLELRTLVAAWLEWQKPEAGTEAGDFLLSLLPADLSADLRKTVWRRMEGVSVDALRSRAMTAGEVARRASARLICLEARMRQWDRLCRVTDQAIGAITADLDAGRKVRFPVRVSDTYKVVRPDGTIAPGLRQTVDLEIVTEEQMWLETAVASGWALTVRRYLGAAALAGSPASLRDAARGKSPRPDGGAYRAGGDRRFVVRYAGTAPAGDADDEHHAPYLICLYAVSALVQSQHMTIDQTRERNRVCDLHGLDRASEPMTGLEWWSEATSLPHLALRHTGRVMLPYREIRLMLAYGCAVARLELMSGLRIGETMQARHGGCFANAVLSGRTVATMRGRPKGWHRDRLWIVDARTMALLKSIKAWVVENWNAATGRLPIVEYGERKRNKERVVCPPARYLFSLGARAARIVHLNRCLRIATLGMPHALSHDYRFAFGKLLKLREATRRQRARALSHDEGSAMVDVYGDWNCEGLDADDAVVAEHQDALARELLDGLLDAA